MRRTKFMILMLLFSSSMLFALGGKETQTTTITWWHSNSGLAGDAANSLIKEFNDTVGKEKGITVQGVYQGKASDVLTKVKAIWQSGASADLPDLVQLDAQAVLDIRDNPSLVCMEDLAKANGNDLSDIVKSTRLSQTYKGKMIGMPFNSSTILLYYNKDAFKEANITEAPKSLDEMTKDASLLLQKDKNGNVTRYAFSGVPTTYELCAWLGQQHGLSLICDQNNGHDGIPTKMVFAENGTMVSFLRKWQELYDTGALENATSGTTTSFASGRTTMILASTSQLTTIMKMVGEKFTLGVAPLPKVDEEATGGVNIGGGALYALDNKSGKQDDVWQFVQFATTPKQQLAWHIATGYFPVNTGTYAMEEFKSYEKEHPLFEVAINQMEASNPELQGIWVPSSYDIYYSFQKGIVKMLQEKATPEETADKLAKEIDSYLSAYLTTQK